MSITNTIRKYVENFRAYLQAEVDLMKYQVVKKVGSLMGMVFTAIFIILLFHIAVAFSGVWLGLWLGSVLNNYVLGFGLTVIIYILWLIISIIFRQQLLIKPFSNIVVHSILEREEIEAAAEKNDGSEEK